MPQRDKLFSQASKHEPRIAHDRQQHLPERLRLTGIEAVGGRPIPGQPQLTQANECQCGLRRGRPDQASEFLRRDAGKADHGLRENRRGEYGVVRQRAHDLSRFRCESETIR